MKIILNNKSSKRQITNVRSQITDKGDLKKFDEFISKHDVFDFNNDEHLNALKKQDCHCNVTVPVTVKA